MHKEGQPSPEYFGVPDTPEAREAEILSKPFRDFVVKVHSRCNLACRYCYVYEHADQSWRTRDVVMPEDTLRQAAARIGDHAEQYNLQTVGVILHGGEPLLIGAEGVDKTVEILRSAMPAGTDLKLGVQTNGILLDKPMLDVLERNNIRVGVSLDGYAEANDELRIYRNGHGSYDDVARGLGLLRDGYPSIYGGILCTVNPNTDAVRTYETLLSFKPKNIDFLLPHGNWTDSPPGRVAETTDTPYADWLIEVFDRWFDAPQMETDIRYLSSIVQMILGGESRVETIGLTPPAFLVIETDGAIEMVDSLKSTYEGAAGMGLNVRDNALSEALAHPGIQAQRLGMLALSQTCVDCGLVKVCGAGYYAHRWRQENGFRNPSVYCPDLTKLIRHIYAKVSTALQAAQKQSQTS